jgi:hypothetical protein
MSTISGNIRQLAFGACAAILAIALPHAAIAQTPPIQACVNRNGKIGKIAQTCGSKQTSLTWNTPGPAGPPGPAGAPGTPGTPGDKLALLTGSGFAGIDTVTTGTTAYFGPGNGESWQDADGPFSLPRESVPLPAGTLSNLNVALDAAPGMDETATFTVCINDSCTGSVTCAISDTETSCNSGTSTDSINQGDRVAIQESGSSNTAMQPHVSWSMNLQLTTP